MYFENEDHSIFNIEKIKDQFFGFIDRQNTDDFKFKKWRSWGGFGENHYSRKLILEQPTMKDALWEFFFDYMCKEDDKEKNLWNVPLMPDIMGGRNLVFFLEKLDLPLPISIELEKLYIQKSGYSYIKWPPEDEDYQKLELNKLDAYADVKYLQQIPLYIQNKQSDKVLKDNLFINVPTNNDKMTNGDFVIYYKEILYKAYKETDFRLLYDPYIRTHCFECPFKGKTPAIEIIRSR